MANNELDVFTKDGAIATYKPTEAVDSAAENVLNEMPDNWRAQYVQIRLSKTPLGIAVSLGDELLIPQAQAITVAVVASDPARVLWPPGKETGRPPACSSNLGATIGHYRHPEGAHKAALKKLPPGQTSGEISCEECPWALFGSKMAWSPPEDGRETQAPACGKMQVLKLVLLTRGAPIENTDFSMYNIHPNFPVPFGIMTPNMSTNRGMIESIGRIFRSKALLWRSKGRVLQMSQMAIRLSASDADEWGNPIVKVEFAGYVNPEVWNNSIHPDVLREEIENFNDMANRSRSSTGWSEADWTIPEENQGYDNQEEEKVPF